MRNVLCSKKLKKIKKSSVRMLILLLGTIIILFSCLLQFNAILSTSRRVGLQDTLFL